MLDFFTNTLDNPFSLIVFTIIVLIIISLLIAIKSHKMEKTLRKLKILDEDESPKRLLVELLIIVAVVFTIQRYLIQPYLVNGSSMVPNMHSGDLLLVDKLHSDYKRGDVVVFKFKQDGSPYDGKFFIKRILATPGETIIVNGSSTQVITKDKETITLDQPYVERVDFVKERTLTLGDDEYFVMGDNRRESYDSRDWGPVHAHNISGVAIIRLFPFNQINFKPAEYIYEK